MKSGRLVWNCTFQQVLKASTWSSQTTSSAFYLRDVTHGFIGTFFIGPVVAAQEVVQLTSRFSHSCSSYRSNQGMTRASKKSWINTSTTAWCRNSHPRLFTVVCDRIPLDPHGPWHGRNVPSLSFLPKTRELEKPYIQDPRISTVHD